MSNVQNIQVKPMLVYVGDNTLQSQKITTVADVAHSLAGHYFAMHEPNGTGHIFWMDDGVASAPAPAGTWTLHAVTYTAGASAATLAGLINTVIAALTTKFTSSVSGNTVTVTNVAAGYAQPARDSLDNTKLTGFGFKVLQIGFVETEIGYLEGDIEISGLSSSKLEIKAHSTGATILDERITGYNKPQLKFTLQETDKNHIGYALKLAGGQSLTPEVSGGTETVGWGPTNVGNGVPTVKLRLHPVQNDSADVSEDWTFWKASFDPDSFKFSGENVSTIPMTVTVYPNFAKSKAVQYFVIGDATGL